MPRTRSTLKIGLYELNGSWKTPWHVSVVVPELAAAQARDVPAVERDRAGRRPGQPEDHPADRRLAAAALADQRDDLAGCDGEADVGTAISSPLPNMPVL